MEKPKEGLGYWVRILSIVFVLDAVFFIAAFIGFAFLSSEGTSLIDAATTWWQK